MGAILGPQDANRRPRPRPRRRRRLAPAAPALISLIAALIVGLAGCGDRPHSRETPPPPPARVQLVVVQARTRTATEEVVGTVQSRLRATVEAKVSGRILKLPVVPGQLVKAGDLIAEVDAQEIKSRHDQAVAAREQAARDIERVRRLLAEKIVSQSEFDDVQARFRIASAAVTEAETMLSYTRVTAPFDAVITHKRAEIGDLASPGRAIADLDDPRQLRLEASVPETAINRLAIGTILPVRIAGLAAPLTATISEMAPSADPASRTFLIKADLPPADGLRAGQFGRADVPIGETTALRVPVTSVFQRGQLEFVAVSAGGRAALRIVKTGKRVGQEVEIVSGLEAGESIVQTGAAALQEGQPLEAQP